MSRKHIDTDVLPPKPIAIRVILTGELAVRFEGQKPRVKLMQLSDSRYEVSYVAHDTTHWRVFDSPSAAERHFRILTGEITPRNRMVA